MRALELRVPPVAVVLVFGLLMWTVSWALPALNFAFPGKTILAIGIALVGFSISVAGVAAFRRARTTVNPMAPGTSSSLVVGSVYTLTRNPMYLGFAFALVAWAVYLGNPVSLLGVPAFIVYMTRFQIQPEETALEERFGADFSAYKARVRRWM